MIRKPWAIIVLAFVHVVAPIGNMIISSKISRLSIPDFVRNFESVWQLIAFFAILPLAGFAIYMVKKWSYALFLVAMGWLFYVSYYSYSQFPQLLPLPMMIAAYSVNIIVVGFFLIPAVRTLYFNPRMRWWEAKPRYKVEVPAQFECNSKPVQGMIGNISEGGIFAQIKSEKFKEGDRLRLRFSYEGLDFDLHGTVMHLDRNTGGMGLKFLLNRRLKRKTKRLIRLIDSKGGERRPPRENPWVGFSEWLKNFVKTGKGLIPELPQKK